MYAGTGVKANHQSMALRGNHMLRGCVCGRRFTGTRGLQADAATERTSDGAHAPGETDYAHGMRLTGCLTALADHRLDDAARPTARSVRGLVGVR